MIINLFEKGVGKVMTKHFCDRCNKEIENIDDGYNLEIVCYQRCRKPEYRYIDEHIFICKECADDIKNKFYTPPKFEFNPTHEAVLSPSVKEMHGE